MKNLILAILMFSFICSCQSDMKVSIDKETLAKEKAEKMFLNMRKSARTQGVCWCSSNPEYIYDFLTFPYNGSGHVLQSNFVVSWNSNKANCDHVLITISDPCLNMIRTVEAPNTGSYNFGELKTIFDNCNTGEYFVMIAGNCAYQGAYCTVWVD